MDRKYAAAAVDRGLGRRRGSYPIQPSYRTAQPATSRAENTRPAWGVGQALPQVTDQLGIGQHLDPLSQPVQFPEGTTSAT
jgi:hypothetical protein